MASVFTEAFRDLGNGLRRRRVWMALATEDVGDQHRRTMLGPLWLVINYFTLLAIFVFLFDRSGGLQNYPVYVATGLLAWMFISEIISSSVALFVREEGMIKGTTLPLSVYVFRLLTNSMIRTCYSIVATLVVLAYFGATFTPTWFWAIPGMMLIVLTAPAAIIIFAFIGAYFPDSQYIVGNLMRVGMFLTPVFWNPEGRGGLRGAVYHMNPFTYFLELVRMPIFESTIPVMAYAVCGTVCVLLWMIALPLLGRFRRSLVFIL